MATALNSWSAVPGGSKAPGTGHLHFTESRPTLPSQVTATRVSHSTPTHSYYFAAIANNLTVASTMSTSTPAQTSTPSSDFKSILDAGLSRALSEYKEKTGKPLLDHPLATKVQQCDSVDAILAIFQGQAKAFQHFRDGDQSLMKWINPMVDILYKFSKTAGEIAGTVRP